MPQKFDLSRFTQKARQALERAQALARKFRHKHVDIEHVLLALLEQDEGVARTILDKLDIDHRPMGRKLIDELELLPRTYRSGSEVFVAKPLLEALQEADRLAKRPATNSAAPSIYCWPSPDRPAPTPESSSTTPAQPPRLWAAPSVMCERVKRSPPPPTRAKPRIS